MTGVLVHPTGVGSSNPEATEHWDRTIASAVDFRAGAVAAALTEQQRATLDALHPDGRCRFWGSHALHRIQVGRVQQDDVVVLTASGRVRGIGRVGLVTTNPGLGEALWPHRHPVHGSYQHLYSIGGFEPADLPVARLRSAGVKWLQTPRYFTETVADNIVAELASDIPHAAPRRPVGRSIDVARRPGRVAVLEGSAEEPSTTERDTATGGARLSYPALTPAEDELLARLEAKGSTDAAGAVRAVRREQAVLRASLGLAPTADDHLVQCGLCGRRLPRRLLIAAHVKPRSECSEKERLDMPHVAMPACVLGCDALYEAGYIAVDPTGRIVTARSVISVPHVRTVLRALDRERAPAWSLHRAQYFAWHREHRFLVESVASSQAAVTPPR